MRSSAGRGWPCRGATASARWPGGRRPPACSAPSSRTPPTPAPSSTAAPGPPPAYASGKLATTPCPMAEWRVVVQDKYPAYVDWAATSGSRRCCATTTPSTPATDARGPPRRRGAAPRHRLVRGVRPQDGRAVQGGTRYVCNHLSASSGEPVCQHLPADPIDAAWWPRSSRRCPRPSWSLGAGRMTTGAAAEAALDGRGPAGRAAALPGGLAERQFNRVDPDNRLVAAELEHRWEAGPAGAAPGRGRARRHRAARAKPEALSAEDRARFLALGPRLPALWRQPGMTRERKKALLRCLIDKVVLRRVAAERIGIRIVWRGGESLGARDRGRGVHAPGPGARRRDGGPAARLGAPGGRRMPPSPHN